LDDNSRGLHFANGDRRYWRYLLTLIDFGTIANPGAVPTIAEEAIMGLRVPAPPCTVQGEIADEVDRFLSGSREVHGAIERQLCLLTERREAIIAAAITGELDVPVAA
jgi:type I restriction enzyme S subunit